MGRTVQVIFKVFSGSREQTRESLENQVDRSEMEEGCMLTGTRGEL